MRELRRMVLALAVVGTPAAAGAQQVTLDTVAVTADAVSARLLEFERRKAAGIGMFLDAAALEADSKRGLTMVLAARLPGLVAQSDRDRPGRYVLRSLRGATSVNNNGGMGGDDPDDRDLSTGGSRSRPGAPATQTGINARVRGGRPTCAIDLYLDGQRYPGTLDEILTGELAGVELHRRESAPPQYRSSSGACQVLLLWTKR